MKDVDRDSMEAGRRYRVTMKDCGIEGEFTATFMGWGRFDWSDYEAESPSLVTGLSLDDEPEFSLWDNGLRLGPVMGYWTVYEVE
ncbi:MAG TPA: hypothetical protein VNO14_07445 [Blastocatellia bacterium]|nr:hypothetical protein [Blastocatellia bacterium]